MEDSFRFTIVKLLDNFILHWMFDQVSRYLFIQPIVFSQLIVRFRFFASPFILSYLLINLRIIDSLVISYYSR